MKLKIIDYTDEFAENKNTARELRDEKILPSLQKGEKVLLDFRGITGATQSFIHALISEVIRQHGPSVFDKIEFQNCSPDVKSIITIVSDYMQEVF